MEIQKTETKKNKKKKKIWIPNSNQTNAKYYFPSLNNGFFRERERGQPICPNRISLAESLAEESGLG